MHSNLLHPWYAGKAGRPIRTQLLARWASRLLLLRLSCSQVSQCIYELLQLLRIQRTHNADRACMRDGMHQDPHLKENIQTVRGRTYHTLADRSRRSRSGRGHDAWRWRSVSWGSAQFLCIQHASHSRHHRAMQPLPAVCTAQPALSYLVQPALLRLLHRFLAPGQIRPLLQLQQEPR
jgi:hypothetical protein